MPAVEDPVVFDVTKPPYAIRSAGADCYFLHANAAVLASLYAKYGEMLLQRNIRVDQRDTPTNRAIETTCSGPDSANFLHFNNGVTFLCDSATLDQFTGSLTLDRAQVVNGGQTVRALHRAHQKASLKPDVLVPVRVVTSRGDKEFASNVAVNQNNQNQMRTGFLRSNDPRLIQLDHALASIGWFLERREGEVALASAEEKATMQHKIGGRNLDGRVIPLKDGTQAYVATFYGQPELAKKDPKKMFASMSDGGSFERIFSPDITAEKFAIAFEIKRCVDDFLKHVLAKKRRKDRTGDLTDYIEIFGDSLVAEFGDQIDQVIRQSAIFLCGSLYQDLVRFRSMDPAKIPAYLQGEGRAVMAEHIGHLLRFARKNPRAASKSWPNLLKSSAFFNAVIAYIGGIREGSQGGS